MDLKRAGKAGSSIAGLPQKVCNDGPVHAAVKTMNETQSAKQTFFIPRKVHKRLKEFCLDHHTSQQQIFIAALELWLRQEGLPSIAGIESEENP